MKLEMMFIGALIFGLVFVVGLGIYGEGLSEYDVSVDTNSTFGQMTHNLKRIYDIQDSTKDQIQGGEVTDADAVDEMIKGGYTGVRSNPFTALTVAANASMTLGKETGFVSAPIIGFFMAVLSILVLFAIIALIFRFQQR